MGTTTTTFALNKPTVGGDDNAWGTDWNTNADKLDDLLDGTTAIKPNLSEGLWRVGGVAVTATAAELNILDGVTASAAEINILDGVTASTAELNILDGVTYALTNLNALTASAAELNVLDGITATTAELNVLDGIDGIASQAEAEAGTNNAKLMTPLRVAQAIDALSDPSGTANTPTRVVGTSYQNTQGKQILVAVAGTNASVTNIFFEMSADNSTWYKVSGRAAQDNGVQIAVSSVVPKSWYYRVTNSAGTFVVATWMEIY